VTEWNKKLPNLGMFQPLIPKSALLKQTRLTGPPVSPMQGQCPRSH